jgi:hypothetical protein
MAPFNNGSSQYWWTEVSKGYISKNVISVRNLLWQWQGSTKDCERELTVYVLFFIIDVWLVDWLVSLIVNFTVRFVDPTVSRCENLNVVYILNDGSVEFSSGWRI